MYITLTVKPAPSMDIQPSFNFETDGHAFMIVSSYILSLFGPSCVCKSARTRNPNTPNSAANND